MNHRRQRIDVCAFELSVLPIIDDLRWQRVLTRQLLEHVHIRARSGLGPFQHRQLQLLEQNLLKLFGRSDVELLAGQFMDFAFQCQDPLTVLLAQRVELIFVDPHPVVFQLHQRHRSAVLPASY